MNFNNFTIKSQEAVQEAINGSYPVRSDEGRRKCD